MAQRLRIPLLILLWLGIGAWAQAPSAAAQHTPAQTEGVVHISLGQSAVPLNGPWKFAVGDSPLDPLTHQPLWAQPGFDDSKWEAVDLTPRNGTFDPVGGFTGYVPGWTARGHAGYWGYAWYRIRVLLEARPGTKLALAGPPDVDDVYQVFDNGKLIGSFGDFSGSQPVTFYTQPMMFPLAQPAGGYAGSSTQVLAFRVWMAPEALATQPDAGGFHTAPVLGESGAVSAGYRLRWLELIRAYLPYAIEAHLYALLAVVVFSLILFDRSDRVYLWMGSVFLLQATSYALSAFDVWTRYLSIWADSLIISGFLTPLIYAGWVMVWWVWFGRQRPAWIPRAAAGLALLFMISNMIGEDLFFTFVPHPVAAAFHMVSLVVRLLLLVLLVWIITQAIRNRGLEGWLVLPAILLLGIGMFGGELAVLHIPVVWFPFGVGITLPHSASLLLVATVALLLLRRLLLSIRRQRLMEQDVKQAREVQQMILPEARTTLPGLAIESEYRPAREVGGDFFQIIPRPADGSLLIVAGDVTGKGLKAGMLVALLVGAIRSTVETNTEPEYLLGVLNRRLLGRGDAQATCLALSIARDGKVTLANAGHLPPYLNGEQVAMEGALPLGMMPGAIFPILCFQMEECDRLVLISDGIVEATDAEGSLFGFERVHNLLRTAVSAAELAGTAQSFGQQDDISVISVTRAAALNSALA
ncbi:MAG: PP2C family protein-serine/threonine phosphatase [Terracidiphilus sp.]